MELILYLIAGVLLFVSIIIAVVAEIKVSSTYSKFSDVVVQSGITGQQLAQKIAEQEGLDVKLNQCAGTLTDNYNPISKTINISKANFDKASISALGVVAHEMGHAIQDKKNYGPYKIRQFVVKTSNAISKMLLPLLIIGIITNLMYVGGIVGLTFIYIAVGFYFLAVLTNLATLPVEINASKRAVQTLKKMNIMDDIEIDNAKKVLSAAAWTYLASLLVSIAYFLRFLAFALLVRKD